MSAGVLQLFPPLCHSAQKCKTQCNAQHASTNNGRSCRCLSETCGNVTSIYYCNQGRTGGARDQVCVCQRTELMHVCCASENVLCVHEWTLLDRSQPLRGTLACMYVFCMSALLCVCRGRLVHTYTLRHPSLFTLALHKKYMCLLVCLRAMVCTE